MSTYVYGIVERAHADAVPFGTTGVGEPPQPVRILAEGDLAAVVSDAPEGLRPRDSALAAHRHVLAAAEAAGCVLPMRFGSIAPDDHAVAAVLAERAEHYRERLRALTGRVEYTVRAAHHEQAVLHRVLAESPELRALAEANRRAGGGTYAQKLQFGEMVTAAVQAQEAEEAAEAQHTLEASAEAVSVGSASEGWLVDVSFLVDRDSAPEFLAAVAGLRRSHPHLDLRAEGPLPPYSFVEPGPAAPAGTVVPDENPE
ncbi:MULTISPECIES: GvpL/GvpF family gas vesicle protein [unclassified Streptomyces]|uniref:GvpL/GvpF family gas vesicle protein n=1 Tax=unclassified Streptomyces TaxID=2593676 RepID=UPI003D706221